MLSSAKFKYIFFSILVLLVSASITKTTLNLLKSNRRLDDLRAEVSELKKKKENLEKELLYKKTDEFVEKAARNELNLVKPGEKVYVVVGGSDNKKKRTEVLSSSSKRGENESVIYQWYRLFF